MREVAKWDACVHARQINNNFGHGYELQGQLVIATGLDTSDRGQGCCIKYIQMMIAKNQNCDRS